MTPLQRKTGALVIATVMAAAAEGLRHTSYYDPPGILTVCYGSTTNVTKGKVYTTEECKARLDDDMLIAMNAVERCVPGLPANVLAAFSDAVYNLGPTIACNTKKSTAARLLREGNIIMACRELPKWNGFNSQVKLSDGKFKTVHTVLPGLVTRRNEEMRVCLGS